MKLALPKSKFPWPKKSLIPGIIVLSLLIIFLLTQTNNLWVNNKKLTLELENQKDNEQKITDEINKLKDSDPYKTNEELKKEIENIYSGYSAAITAYESLLDYKQKTKKTTELDTLFAESLSLLADKNYTKAISTIDNLNNKITQETASITPTPPPITQSQSVVADNSTPQGGYSRQKVSTEVGDFTLDIIASDLKTTKVIVDTASSADCRDNCPVLPLSSYVSRNGAYAAVNGSYFCPASYPTCAGKTNSFDTLLMNKDKTYFNSDNNVYSTNPAVIFGGGYIRFIESSSQWGRDASIESMISNYPLLVSGGNLSFGGDDDPKKGSKGTRSFVANKGTSVFIGVVHNATVAESARVLKSLGMENALNLDNGGSTALYSNGYKVGPGRDIPNAILFINK